MSTSAPSSRPRTRPSGAVRSQPLRGMALAILVSLLPGPWASAGPRPAESQVPDSVFHGLAARNIGPGGTSGRIAAIDAVGSPPQAIYVGAATGGVWKSTDAGTTWVPIFDDQPTASVGAIAVSPANPDVVWVGTGEANPRNSAGVGRGVFRSLDGGRSWRFVGLGGSERISRIVAHPSDPAVAYVAALGPAWSDGEERGVFKTTDGGVSWRKVLYVDARTGAADLEVDPTNPDRLVASMWEYRREPWFLTSGGPGSGIWHTHDGGDTWTRVGRAGGLPAGDLGRIGLAIAPSDPRVVYALVEAEKSALLRSEDGGRTWRTVNDEPNVNPRPFYYADIRVDPVNENRVYRLASLLDMSEDGGKTFTTIATWASVHPDHHALWIDPADGRTLLDGNDGGVAISHNRGQTWRFVHQIPVAQFYHLSVDMARPFNVYGGLQDNGSWMGPSEVWENASFVKAGIMNHHWRTIGFGDGFAAVIDPADPTYGFSMSQGGNLVRFDLRTGEWKRIRPTQPEDTVDLRFNWNAGIALDPHDPATVYYGSQYVHRSRDRGHSWDVISPDLTTNDPSKQNQAESGGLTKDVSTAENHTTILTIAPSPVERGVIWVGTDDGNVQVTRDGGASWTNVAPNIRGVPAATWVPHVEASKFDGGTAFVVFDDHRRGDWTPYVYRTTDYGATWTSLATPEIDGYVHVVEQDPVEPDLLFLGTEFGLFVSLDGGGSWRKWTHGFPTVPVRALVVHPRDHDLAVGTHGRGAWIVDDVRPLRDMAGDRTLAAKPLHLFEIPPATQHRRAVTGPYYFPGDSDFHGGNREYGALISYHVAGALRSAPSDTAAAARVAIQILDGDEVIRELEGPAEPGVNRVAWDLRGKPYRRPGAGGGGPFGPGGGPEVLPGPYTVRVKAGGQEATGTVEVLPDPRRDVAMAERRDKLEALDRVGRGLERVADAVERLEGTRKALELVNGRIADLDEGPARDSLRAQGRTTEERLDALLDGLRRNPGTVGIVRDRSVASLLGSTYAWLDSSLDRPTEGAVAEARRNEERLAEAMTEVDRFYAETLAAFRRAVDATGLDLWGSGP